jgi:hypothetical protein
MTGRPNLPTPRASRNAEDPAVKSEAENAALTWLAGSPRSRHCWSSRVPARRGKARSPVGHLGNASDDLVPSWRTASQAAARRQHTPAVPYSVVVQYAVPEGSRRSGRALTHRQEPPDRERPSVFPPTVALTGETVGISAGQRAVGVQPHCRILTATHTGGGYLRRALDRQTPWSEALFRWWQVQDSNLRRHTPTDLQSDDRHALACTFTAG